MASTDTDTTPKCPIYEHDASIITHLTPHLPHSLSLIRRIQHGLSYPSSTAKILATFPPSAPAAPPETPWLAARVDLSRGRETQIILYSSLEKMHTSMTPTIPVPGTVPVTQSDGIVDSTSTTATSRATSEESIVVSTFTAAPALLEQTRNQLLSLLAHVKRHLLPEYLASLPSSSAEATPGPEDSDTTKANGEANGNGVPLIPPPPPQAFLIGSLHTALYALLMRSGVYAQAGENAAAGAGADPLPGLRIHRFDYPPYYKYFFRRDVFDPEVRGEGEGGGDLSLPSGYRFHDRQGRTGVLDCHLDLVQSRTHIPRSRAQLSSMPGVAIYHDGDGDEDGQRAQHNEDQEETPIAWGFLGLDGALATLHVEPAHRGKGLALPLCRQIMRRGMASGVFGAGSLPIPDADKERVGEWVHTEVAQYNRASRRVMEKIGGVVLASVIWTVVEVCD